MSTPALASNECVCRINRVFAHVKKGRETNNNISLCYFDNPVNKLVHDDNFQMIREAILSYYCPLPKNIS